MVNGVHMLLYSRDAEADRRFLRDTLGLRAVDAGEGWLIFGLPPAELGVHPSEDDDEQTAAVDDGGFLGSEMYLMCEDVGAVVRSLRDKGVDCPAPHDVGWGILTRIPLPSGGAIGLYQPRHPTALGLT
jgi:catechol 2,3-dioxygenase-like lactoylglutathione lyase family enzyme